MSSTTSTPYDWLRHIPRSVLELDDIPLFGYSLTFPWEELSESLSIDLGLDQLSIQATDTQWRQADDLYKNLGDNLVPLNLAISGLEGSICWVMPRDSLHYMASKLLNSNEMEIAGLENDLEDGIYRFLGYQIISTIGRINWDKALAIHILNQKELPAEAALCIDVKASWSEYCIQGRLILSQTFQKAWKERFADRTLEMPGLRQKSLAEQIEATVHLEVGRTSFTAQEWKEVQTGDFILLESCGLKENGNKGRVTLTLHGVPLYQARLKDGGIKIVEHPEYREVNATMDKDVPDEEFEDDEFKDDFDEEFEEENFEESTDEPLDDEFKDELEESATEEKGEPVSLVREKEPPASPTEIPMNIVVEVGRIKMSIQKIMDLQPGNVLDLNINPEDGVDLTVNGRRIAKGELLRVGETLGVRILDIG